MDFSFSTIKLELHLKIT